MCSVRQPYTKLLRSTQFDVYYDIVFSILTLAPIWFLSVDVLTKIENEIYFIVLVLITLYALHHDGNRLRVSDWALFFCLGVVVAVFAIFMEPIWRVFGLLAIEGKWSHGIRQLNSTTHSNPLLFIGLAACYVAFVGFVRQVAFNIISSGRGVNR